MKKPDLPQMLLIAAMVLIPIGGGYLVTDTNYVTPGASPGLSAILGSPDLPLLGQILPILLTVAAYLIAIRRRVVQVPFLGFGASLAALAVCTGAAILWSSFKMSSFISATQVFAGCLIPFAIIAVSGRNEGPRHLLCALFIGIAGVAMYGVMEYAQNKAIDPSWRIFSTYINPNALGGLLIMGFLLGIGLTLTAQRVEAIAFGAGTVAVGFALYLTQSKGAFLALFVGSLFALLTLIIFLKKSVLSGRVIGKIGAIVAVCAILVFAVSRPSTSGAAPSPGARVMQASTTQEQSVGFRQLLWRSAGQLMLMNPAGWGPGTFRYESTRPGLTPQTVMAHNGFLQMGAETGIVSIFCFLSVIGFWTAEMFRGKQTTETNKLILKSAVLGAVAASLAHNMVDSDLQHFGLIASLFCLLGVGVQLSADAITPEVISTSSRTTFSLAATCLALMTTYVTVVDWRKATVRGEQMVGQVSSTSIRSLAPMDGEAYILDSFGTADPALRLELVRAAAMLAPSMRNFRLLSGLHLESGDFRSAEIALEKALERDPNNLPALLRLLKLQIESKNLDQAKDTLDKMISVENKAYFKVRALPELIPTETYEARVLMAEFESNPRDATQLNKDAIKGFADYARVTGPKVIQFNASSPPIPFAGETLDDLKQKILLAEKAIKVYRGSGDSDPETDAAVESLRASKLALGLDM